MSHNSHTSLSNNLVTSTHAPQVGGKNVTVNSPAGNPIEFGGDMSCWDTVTGAFVNVDRSQVGTTVLPKL